MSYVYHAASGNQSSADNMGGDTGQHAWAHVLGEGYRGVRLGQPAARDPIRKLKCTYRSAKLGPNLNSIID